MPVDWSTMLTVDSAHVAGLLTSQHSTRDAKISIRGFSIPFVGTQQSASQIIECLRRQLLKYVFPERERPADIDWALARDRFGDINPESDGKLGEMLLYLLVEAYLQTPLIAYKLKDLTNFNDQVKGADGVFVGEYDGKAALLIGESKIHKTLESAIASTIESLHRFHDTPGFRARELLISKKYPPQRDLTPDQLQAIEPLLDGKAGVLVHPVFVSYDLAAIPRISSGAKDADEAEAALKAEFFSEAELWSQRIAAQRAEYPKPFQVYLDFFFLPVENCLTLRNDFYEMLHGHPYESNAVRAVRRQAKRETKAWMEANAAATEQ